MANEEDEHEDTSHPRSAGMHATFNFQSEDQAAIFAACMLVVADMRPGLGLSFEEKTVELYTDLPFLEWMTERLMRHANTVGFILNVPPPSDDWEA